MQLRKVATVLTLLLIISLLFDFGISGTAESTVLTWYSEAVSYYSIYIDANFTPNLGETKIIKIKALAAGNGVEDLDVLGYMLKPDGSTQTLDFYEVGDGNYIRSFKFEQNGVYTLYVTASDENKNTAIASEYFYCGTYEISITTVGNNVFAPGENATLMFFASVSSQPLKHAEGRITIWQPSGNVFVNKATLVELSTPGYYAYTFTAQNILGEYRYNVTFSSGKNAADYNGKFRVTSILVCGNGICEAGENCKNCPKDCGECIPGGGGGSGGGGGGGGGQITITPTPTQQTPEPFVKPEVKISELKVEPLKVGEASFISGIIENLSDKKIDIVISVVIKQEAEIEYIDERTYLGVEPLSKQRFSMLLPWTPEASGLHVMSVNVYSIDKSTKFATETKLIDLGGELRYDLSALCTTPVVTAGTTAYFDVSAYNVGTYYTDIMLSWSIEDSNGKVYVSSSTPIAIKPGGKADKHIVETISEAMKSGNYFFRAKLSTISADSNFQQREAMCAFYVAQKEKTDYSLTIFELKQRIQKVKSKIRALKAKEFEVSEIEDEAKKLEDELISAEAQIQRNELESPSTKLVQLSLKIGLLEEEIESFSESERGVDLSTNFILLLVVLITLAFVPLYCAFVSARDRQKKLIALKRRQILLARKFKAHGFVSMPRSKNRHHAHHG
ncbi:MAG: hypothetical protein N3F05_04795 [Candidatus Diapherotrites archaeon]|nr:hypothetical protein [Candidatus Diapherotrites archaeon]